MKHAFGKQITIGLMASLIVAGPVFAETCGACINLENRPKMIDIVFGLGGRDFTVQAAKSVFERLSGIAAGGAIGEVYTHMGQREA